MRVLERIRTVFTSRQPAPVKAGGGGEPSSASARRTNPVDRQDGIERLRRDRRVMIDAMILVSDQVGSDMLRERLTDALTSAGVTPLEPNGERFDPRLHDSAGRRETDDPALDGLVAATLVSGWQDGDTAVRLPRVYVWHLPRSHR